MTNEKVKYDLEERTAKFGYSPTSDVGQIRKELCYDKIQPCTKILTVGIKRRKVFTTKAAINFIELKKFGGVRWV